jgi:hypothetical protein
MLIGMIDLLQPALGRIPDPAWLPLALSPVQTLVFLVPLFFWDLFTLKRIHPATLWGSAVIAAVMFAEIAALLLQWQYGLVLRTAGFEIAALPAKADPIGAIGPDAQGDATAEAVFVVPAARRFGPMRIEAATATSVAVIVGSSVIGVFSNLATATTIGAGITPPELLAAGIGAALGGFAGGQLSPRVPERARSLLIATVAAAAALVALMRLVA